MRLVISVAFLIWPTLAAVAAPNDFEVQSVSNSPGISEHDKFERGAQVNIPEGGKVTLVDRTGGVARIRVCAGKYNGTIEACPKPDVADRSIAVPGGSRAPRE